MNEQQSQNNSVDDFGNVVRTIEEKPGGNTASGGNDLKQPVTGESSDLDPKKKRFQITGIALEDDVEESDMGNNDGLQLSVENVATHDQNSEFKGDTNAANVQPKKKISFQVTSIESTEGRRRGDSNGYDDNDELNESEFVEEEEESPDSTLSHASGINSNGTSRFKVVKIPRYDSKPYTRGRWQCWDLVYTDDDAPPSASPFLRAFKSIEGEKNIELDSVSSSGISEVNSACSGLELKGTSSDIELVGSVQQHIGCETQIQDEKNPVVKNDFVGNPGSSGVDECRDSVINNSSGLGKSFESQIIQSVGTLPQADETILRLNDLSEEDEVVTEKIKKAMNQVVRIKTDLLQDVNAERKKLKQIIQKLTNENHRLKEEIESLKQKLSNQTKTESI